MKLPGTLGFFWVFFFPKKSKIRISFVFSVCSQRKSTAACCLWHSARHQLHRWGFRFFHGQITSVLINFIQLQSSPAACHAIRSVYTCKNCAWMRTYYSWMGFTCNRSGAWMHKIKVAGSRLFGSDSLSLSLCVICKKQTGNWFECQTVPFKAKFKQMVPKRPCFCLIVTQTGVI